MSELGRCCVKTYNVWAELINNWHWDLILLQSSLERISFEFLHCNTLMVNKIRMKPVIETLVSFSSSLPRSLHSFVQILGSLSLLHLLKHRLEISLCNILLNLLLLNSPLLLSLLLPLLYQLPMQGLSLLRRLHSPLLRQLSQLLKPVPTLRTLLA